MKNGSHVVQKTILLGVLASSTVCIALTSPTALAQTITSTARPNTPAVPQAQKLVEKDITPYDFSKQSKPNKQSSGIWQQLGEGPVNEPSQVNTRASSGRVSSIAVRENHGSETIFLGSASGGVWSSNNNGNAWNPLTDDQASLSTGSVAIDPTHPNVMYVGTGEQHFSADSQYGKGILKSTDGGETWSVLGAGVFGGQHIGKVAVDPYDASSVWVAADRGLFHSTDAGTSWSQVLGWRFGPGNRSIRATDVYIDANKPGTMYANFTYYGLQKSTDGGVTWTPINRGLPGWLGGFHSAAMAVVEGKGGSADTLYASAVNISGELMGMFVSKDGGDTWSKLDNVPQYFDLNFSYTGVYDADNALGQGPYDNTIAVDPTNPQHILAGGVTLIESRDGGQTWTVLDTFLDKSHAPIADIQAGQHTITFDSKGNAFIGNDGGIFEETAKGAWRNLNTVGLSTMMLNPGLSAIDKGRTVMAGSEDNGTLLVGRNSAWSQVYAGSGGFTYMDPQNPNVMYLESQYGNIVRRTDPAKDGNTWFPSSPGYVDNAGAYTAPFLTPYTVRPMTGKNQGNYEVIVGSGCVARSTDGGNTYDAISPDFTMGPFIDPVVALSQSQSDPNVVYAGTTYGQVYASFDAESVSPHWTRITPFANDFANYPDRRATVSAIAINPSSDKQITVTYGSQGGITPTPGQNNHVYTCNDATATTPAWVNVTGNLPFAYVDSAQYVGNVVLVGTEQGVFAAASGNASWVQVGTGLPNAPVTSIVPVDGGKIVVGTYGRGAFTLDLPIDLAGLLQ